MSTTSTVAIPERTTNNHTSLMAVLFIGFILSGIATTIIGPMLPVFIRKWNLDDGQAGLFSSIQFLASLVGTVVSGAWTAWRGYRPSLVAGYAFMGFGLANLNASTHANALAATAAFGLGYGLITPGTNLCVAETGGPRRASLLNLLNFTWGMGAMACSPMIAVALRNNLLSCLASSLAMGFSVLFWRWRFCSHASAPKGTKNT
jgi:MFS family permease